MFQVGKQVPTAIISSESLPLESIRFSMLISYYQIEYCLDLVPL